MCTCTYILWQNLPGTYSTCSVSHNLYYCIKITASNTTPRQFQRNIHNWFTKTSFKVKRSDMLFKKMKKYEKSQLSRRKLKKMSFHKRKLTAWKGHTHFDVNFQQLLAFLNLHQHAKNQFIPLHPWDTPNFRILCPEWPHSF